MTLLVESCTTVEGCGAWVSTVADLWRVSQDIEASWLSIMNNLDAQNSMAAVATAGHYNDPDLLQVGNYGLTEVEWRTMMTMWCLTNAPLFVSTDLRSLSSRPEVLSILSNEELLNLNSFTNRQGQRLSAANDTGTELWAKALESNKIAFAVLNRGGQNASRVVNLRSIGPKVGLPSADRYLLRDLWRRTDVGVYTGVYEVIVRSHEAAVFSLSAVHASHFSSAGRP